MSQPPAREPQPAPATPRGSGPAPYGWAPPPGAPVPATWAQPWPAPVLEKRSTGRTPLVLAVVALAALLVGGVAGFLLATVAFMTVTGGTGWVADAGMAEEPLPPAEEFPAVPPGDLGPDPVLDEYADACFAGDFQACDDLLYESPPLSEYEEYAGTCGGRVKAYDVATCTDLE